jgi:phage host-nuclease inhibitor protein Gam
MKKTAAKPAAQRPLGIKPAIANVDQLDNEIRDIAQLQLDATDRETEMQQLIHRIELEHGEAIKRLKEQLALRVEAVLDFAAGHKVEVFGEKKSRKFNYGTLQLSKESSKVEFLVEETKLIANLKRAGYDRGVVKTIESVDKEVLRGAVPEEKRAAIGFDIVKTGGNPTLTIDKRSIEVLRDARKQQQRKVS